MGINTSKPLDGSDVTDLETAREEIKRLRAAAALGANNILLLTDSYKVTHWVQYVMCNIAVGVDSVQLTCACW